MNEKMMDEQLDRLKTMWSELTAQEGDIIPLMQEAVKNWVPSDMAQERGIVLTVGDGIATVGGLGNVTYGEILIFSNNIRGMVQDLKRGEIGCILFGDEQDIYEGSVVKRTGKTAGIPVGDLFLGRVIDALGNPIDGRGKIHGDGYRPVEAPAPGIIDRQPVDRPMETGLLAIDAMFPIGRGQRELIIGDRQTGKTAIALDTILNQKGKGVICIYVAIGQKASSVAQLVETLKKHDAMKYSIVVAATAGDAAPLQYIAPYAGCALGEYFMGKGKDVLIVYDDLSKHAIAYRALSLLLERSPGREAYPGDVFYLHSRLLERSAQLSEELGGGSMTALPIVETQAGDVSAYIPTNIISITDGQIFLESSLFFAGQRPAVNVGLSVSRVGGNAQTKAMKRAAGDIRLELAQYREMEVFMQFSSDLDEVTKRQLAFGQGLMELLKQAQYCPLKQVDQVILLTAALNHVMQNVSIRRIPEFGKGLIAYVKEQLPDVCMEIEKSGALTDDGRERILEVSRQYRNTVKEE
ncbi:MAG: F0F1 ATP synthase subunit alpha [Firmicutes bacterium]|nr:F0F1 ATP synthase subunit alpha [Bacillota bacterium]